MTVLVQSVAGVVVFEADSGKRIAASYYDGGLRSREVQLKLEKELISKARTSSAMLASVGTGKVEKTKDAKIELPPSPEMNEVVLIDEYVILLRLASDVLIAVIAREEQNDLLMADYLTTLHSCLTQIAGGSISAKKLFSRLDQVFLVIDESIEAGIIFETDPAVIVARIAMHESTPDGVPAARTSMRDGLAAISRGDTDSLRSVFAGAAQSFGSFLGR